MNCTVSSIVSILTHLTHLTFIYFLCTQFTHHLMHGQTWHLLLKLNALHELAEKELVTIRL